MKKLITLLSIILITTLTSCHSFISEENAEIKHLESGEKHKYIIEINALPTNAILFTNHEYKIGDNPFIISDSLLQDYQISIHNNIYMLYDNGKFIGIFKPSTELDSLVINDNK